MASLLLADESEAKIIQSPIGWHTQKKPKTQLRSNLEEGFVVIFVIMYTIYACV